MAVAQITGIKGLGGPLSSILDCEAISPGDPPSYQVCKDLMAYHPLGAKLTEAPIELAQSQQRKITVQDGPEDDLVEQFQKTWKLMLADQHIFNTAKLARGYGIATLGVLTRGKRVNDPLDLKKLVRSELAFNVWDPLNTAGSLTLNQDPTSPDFQKPVGVSVGGSPVHRSRVVTIQNEQPLYIEWTNSAFGFTGRSVFQRILYPLKTYLRSMVTDDMVETKVGVIVAKRRGPSSIIDQAMEAVGAFVRGLLKMAQTGQVMMIEEDEDIKSLDLTNLAEPHALARKNTLDNIATGAGMPAAIINQETFAEGFGEGTEDAKRVAQFVNREREWLQPLYEFMDDIVMRVGWDRPFHERMLKKHPGSNLVPADYDAALYSWMNSYEALWPSFIEEPESEKIKVDDVKLKAVIAVFEVLYPALMADPEARGQLIQWVCDCFNERKELFPSPLSFDVDALVDAMAEQAEAQQKLLEQGGGGEDGDETGDKEPSPNPPFSSRDSDAGGPGLPPDRVRVVRALAELDRSVGQLPDLARFRERRRRA